MLFQLLKCGRRDLSPLHAVSKRRETRYCDLESYAALLLVSMRTFPLH